MSQNIQLIYQNGVFRPLQPLDLPENKIYDADLRETEENQAETIGEKADRVLREAGLISSIKFPNAKKLSNAERRRIGKLFSGEKPLGDYIDEDREARG
jgi:predicted DNA-binding antitoxin AbrB/MazE fold protein